MRITIPSYMINLSAADRIRLQHCMEEDSKSCANDELKILVRSFFARQGVKHPSRKSNDRSEVRAG